MGRPAKRREPIERAIVDLLAAGPRRANEALAEMVRRTGASEGTIRRWSRPLYELVKRGRPGDPDAGWWWRLNPKTTGIGPKITATEVAGLEAPKITGTPGGLYDSPGMPSNMPQSAERVDSREMTKTTALSLLDGAQWTGARTPQRLPQGKHHRTSEREAVLAAFEMSTENIKLTAITLTVPPGDPDTGAISDLAEAVAWCGGGLWVVPQTGEGTEHEHHHGLVAGIDPQRVLAAWVRLTGGTRSAQDVTPIYRLRGWLAYARRKAGFDVSRIIATGVLRDPWIWALGQAGCTLPTPPSAMPTMRPMLRMALLALQGGEGPSNDQRGHDPHRHEYSATAAAPAR